MYVVDKRGGGGGGGGLRGGVAGELIDKVKLLSAITGKNFLGKGNRKWNNRH